MIRVFEAIVIVVVLFVLGPLWASDHLIPDMTCSQLLSDVSGACYVVVGDQSGSSSSLLLLLCPQSGKILDQITLEGRLLDLRIYPYTSYLYVVMEEKSGDEVVSCKAKLFFVREGEFFDCIASLSLQLREEMARFAHFCATLAGWESIVLVTKLVENNLSFHYTSSHDVTSRQFEHFEYITAIAAHPAQPDLLLVAGKPAEEDGAEMMLYSLSEQRAVESRRLFCIPDEISFARYHPTCVVVKHWPGRGSLFTVINIPSGHTASLQVADGCWQWDIAPDGSKLFFSTVTGKAFIWDIWGSYFVPSFTRLAQGSNEAFGLTVIAEAYQPNKLSGRFSLDSTQLFVNGPCGYQEQPAIFDIRPEFPLLACSFNDVPLRDCGKQPLCCFLPEGFMKVGEWGKIEVVDLDAPMS